VSVDHGSSFIHLSKNSIPTNFLTPKTLFYIMNSVSQKSNLQREHCKDLLL